MFVSISFAYFCLIDYSLKKKFQGINKLFKNTSTKVLIKFSMLKSNIFLIIYESEVFQEINNFYMISKALTKLTAFYLKDFLRGKFWADKIAFFYKNKTVTLSIICSPLTLLLFSQQANSYFFNFWKSELSVYPSKF